jgi:hypothetical protein
MIFSQALELMDKGKSVARRSRSTFFKNIGIAKDSNGSHRVLNYDTFMSSILWTPTPEDMIASDWEVVDSTSGEYKEQPQPPARKGFAPGNYYNTCYECLQVFTGAKRCLSCDHCVYVDWKPNFKHLKTGNLYMFVEYCKIEKEWEDGVIYESIDGTRIVRPRSEFLDPERYLSFPPESKHLASGHRSDSF